MITDQRFYHVFVGTYGNEKDNAIQLLLFDSKNGTLNQITSTSGIAKPSFVTVNKGMNRLYAVSEVDAGEVACYAIDFVNGKLKEINRQSTQGSSPCYVSLDRNEERLFIANYGGGSVTVHVLDEAGVINSLSDWKNYSDPNQQKPSHPHAISNIPNTDKYIVTDLGLDRLYLYQFDQNKSKLGLINEFSTVTGSGPRHFTVHPELRKIYVVNEFNSRISVYSYDEAVESLELVQQIETIPTDFEGDNYCADIHISPSGSYLYASNRGHHSIAAYKIMGDGKLEMINHLSTLGEWPRNFAIVPNEAYVLVANERSNSIVIMKIGEDGKLEETDISYSIKKPVCLHITPIKD